MRQKTKDEIQGMIDASAESTTKAIKDKIVVERGITSKAVKATEALVKAGIESAMSDFLSSEDGVLNKRIDDRLKLILKDHKFLKTVATHLAVAEAHRMADKRERAVEELSEKEVEMRDSPEPWFDMVMFGHDPEKGAKIQTEWNNAFIKYLRELGFRGQDEEQMVQHYIGMIGAEALASEIDA
jgi:hypothetical protein